MSNDYISIWETDLASVKSYREAVGSASPISDIQAMQLGISQETAEYRDATVPRSWVIYLLDENYNTTDYYICGTKREFTERVLFLHDNDRKYTVDYINNCHLPQPSNEQPKDLDIIAPTGLCPECEEISEDCICELVPVIETFSQSAEEEYFSTL